MKLDATITGDETARAFLAILLTLFALAVGIPLYRRQWKPITITKARSRQNRLMEYGLLGGLFGWTAWLLHVIACGTDDALLKAFGGIYDFGAFQVAARFLGAALALCGLALVALGIAEMKDEWRIGIDEQDPQTRVVQTGVFKALRHPIYTGVCFMTAGAVLILPHLVTATLAVGSIAGAVAQMRIEERHMRARFGDAYK